MCGQRIFNEFISFIYMCIMEAVSGEFSKKETSNIYGLNNDVHAVTNNMTHYLAVICWFNPQQSGQCIYIRMRPKLATKLNHFQLNDCAEQFMTLSQWILRAATVRKGCLMFGHKMARSYGSIQIQCSRHILVRCVNDNLYSTLRSHQDQAIVNGVRLCEGSSSATTHLQCI